MAIPDSDEASLHEPAESAESGFYAEEPFEEPPSRLVADTENTVPEEPSAEDASEESAEEPASTAIQREEPPPSLSLARNTAELEQRVRRLEEALALLQQGKPIPPPATGAPQAVPITATPAAIPTARVLTTPPEPGHAKKGNSWLFWEMLTELRVIWRMYTDPRYQLSWFGRLVPLALLLIFIFSQWIIPLASVPVLGGWFEQIGQLIVAYLLVKCLSHEARRYRQTAPDLPASLRL